MGWVLPLASLSSLDHWYSLRSSTGMASSWMVRPFSWYFTLRWVSQAGVSHTPDSHRLPCKRADVSCSGHLQLVCGTYMEGGLPDA